MLYQFEASGNYNPEPHLGEIRAPLWAINSADDEVNPPELGQVPRAIEKVKRGRYILIPTSEGRACTARTRKQSCGGSIWWICCVSLSRTVV
jgi:hypothetical protein